MQVADMKEGRQGPTPELIIMGVLRESSVTYGVPSQTLASCWRGRGCVGFGGQVCEASDGKVRRRGRVMGESPSDVTIRGNMGVEGLISQPVNGTGSTQAGDGKEMEGGCAAWVRHGEGEVPPRHAENAWGGRHLRCWRKFRRRSRRTLAGAPAKPGNGPLHWPACKSQRERARLSCTGRRMSEVHMGGMHAVGSGAPILHQGHRREQGCAAK